MRHSITQTAFLVFALFICSWALRAEDALGKPADNKIFAQALVNDLVKNNPDVILIGFHAVAPSAAEQSMIACTHDLIGEKDDEGDLAVVAGQQMMLAPDLKNPGKYKVFLPLKDAAGKSIGLLTLNFKHQAGNDETHYCARALAVRNSAAQRIENLAALFAPAP
jgi:hypothetical protein